MSNDLKYLYMSSFIVKLVFFGGVVVVVVLFFGIGVLIIVIVVIIIIVERINFDRGIIVRFFRNKIINLFVFIVVW